MAENFLDPSLLQGSGATTLDSVLRQSQRNAQVAKELPALNADSLSPQGGLESAFDSFSPGQQTNFETKLTPEEEQQFQIWKQTNAPNDSGFDYDLRGAFKAGVTPDPTTGHWPDTFKKPVHSTFSDQSQYASDAPGMAGKWRGESFIPNVMTPMLDPQSRLREHSAPPPPDNRPFVQRLPKSAQMETGLPGAIHPDSLGLPSGHSLDPLDLDSNAFMQQRASQRAPRERKI